MRPFHLRHRVAAALVGALALGLGGLVMVEKWASPAALATHRDGAALAALGGALRGKVTAAPDVQVLQPVPAGDAAKGEL